MGAHSKVIIATEPGTRDLVGAAMRAASLKFTAVGDFLIVDDADADLHEGNAQALSQTLNNHVVAHWKIHTATNLIALQAWRNGERVRHIHAVGDEGVIANSGSPLPFENTEALNARLNGRRLSASPGGYAVLEAFLGKGILPPEEDLEIRDNAFTVRTFLPEKMVREIRRVSLDQETSPTIFLSAVWEHAKHSLLEVYKSTTPPDGLGNVSDVALSHSQPPVGVSTQIPATKRGVLTGEGVLCELALPSHAANELQAMRMAFDRPISAFIKEAYRMTRAL
jgi:hypothetical protein